MRDLFKIQYPIIQAPMAGSDNAAFVAAASNAGVLGSLGAQYRTPDGIKKAIADIRELTDKPFAVNVFALEREAPPGNDQIAESRGHLQKYYEHFGISSPSNESVINIIEADAQLQVLLEERVPVLSFTLGILSDRWIQAFKEASILLIGTATNVKEARALEAAGVDAITAQGSEAGGHRGTFIGSAENSMIGGLALIPQIVDAVKVPVIAAGGIMDGRGIAAAFALGAKGVQMGTAFLTSTECPVHTAYKRAVKTHDADDTVITRVFSGAPARGLQNEYIASNTGKPLLPFPYHNSLTKPFRQAANETGQIEYTNLWSGQSGRLAREVSIKTLLESLVAETDAVARALRALKLS